MKYTQKERHIMYLIMLADVEEQVNQKDFDDLDGFCYLIAKLFGMEDGSYCAYNKISIEKEFPELWKRRPSYINSDHTGLWFGHKSWEQRLQILRQAIEETANSWDMYQVGDYVSYSLVPGSVLFTGTVCLIDTNPKNKKYQIRADDGTLYYADEKYLSPIF